MAGDEKMERKEQSETRAQTQTCREKVHGGGDGGRQSELKSEKHVAGSRRGRVGMVACAELASCHHLPHGYRTSCALFDICSVWDKRMSEPRGSGG